MLDTDAISEGPPRYFLPVCVLVPRIGFVGGPNGYQEVGEDERDRGPVIVPDNFFEKNGRKG